ncbi:Hypothetical_protein [Hexamita inflata]|uniref:Hypothetical_protein n=1 Tax=Hexamita inflata TaxID=28002 RepID=A0AA86R3Z3_9EUKA|nr:Hypothetical protein HINF_LOCUS57680 [Hexamita inflata]
MVIFEQALVEESGINFDCINVIIQSEMNSKAILWKYGGNTMGNGLHRQSGNRQYLCNLILQMQVELPLVSVSGSRRFDQCQGLSRPAKKESIGFAGSLEILGNF